MVQHKLTFITGGVRSGKSAYAEKVLREEVSKTSGRLVYIASGVALDDEMKERIEKHRLDRLGDGWFTIEQPINLQEVYQDLRPNDYVLWDCMTTWLANELYEGWETTPCIHKPGCIEEKASRLQETIALIQQKVAHFVIVSNEVFHEPTSLYTDTECYRKWLGQLHQLVVERSTTAIEMESGIPIYWKGGASS